MPVTLSIKNAPDHIVAVLRDRAVRHHRSLQGELMSILEEAARTDLPVRLMTVREVAELAERIGPISPSSVNMIREDRDR